jgi:mono/diheme cytochrome c family protein
MRVSRFVLFPFAACALTIASSVQAQAVDSLVKTTLSDDQIGRGQTVFTKVCAECHTKTDMSGPDFKLKWHTRPVFDLFEVIRTTMPDNGPGTLAREQYIDVTAYLLRLNGAPTGGMPIVDADTAGMRKLRIDITVPAPNVDSLKIDSTKVKVDTTKVKVDTIGAKRDTVKAKVDTLAKRTPLPQFLRQTSFQLSRLR